MSLQELLRERERPIVDRWTDEVLAVYPEDGALAFHRQKDRFANPVGHSAREGTREVYRALVDGGDPEAIEEALFEMIRIRAIQQLPPSRALAFVGRLKEIVRAELGGAARDPGVSAELAALDREIDRIALQAFDVYARCREELYRIRVNEVKRRVEWIVKKLDERGADAASLLESDEWV